MHLDRQDLDELTLTERAARLLRWTTEHPDQPLSGRDVAYFLSGRNDRTVTMVGPDHQVGLLTVWISENLTHEHFREWSDEDFARKILTTLAGG